MQPARLTVLGSHPHAMTIGAFKNIVICCWCGQATGPAVNTLRATVDAVLARGTELYTYIHVIRDRVKLPDADARTGLIEVMRVYEARTACVAIVVGGSGFWASAMRNAVIGLRVVAPRSFEYRLHAEPSEVLEWLPQAHRKRSGIDIPTSVLDLLLTDALSWQPATG
jgi:hypothetical protein